jgi:hypothetical protein
VVCEKDICLLMRKWNMQVSRASQASWSDPGKVKHCLSVHWIYWTCVIRGPFVQTLFSLAVAQASISTLTSINFPVYSTGW